MYYWKLGLASLVLFLTLWIILADFSKPVDPEWNLLQGTRFSPSSKEDGAKAALLAMCGAATLFISFMPQEKGPSGRILDTYVRAVGAIAVGGTGWYWLSSETDGQPGLYLLALVPILVIYACGSIVMTMLIFSSRKDNQLIRETGSSKLTWGDAVRPIATVLVVLGLFVSTVYIPRWFF